MSFGFTRLLQSPLRLFTGFGAPVNRQIHHITGFNPTPATRVMPSIIQNSPSQLIEAGSPHMTAGGAWSFITTRFWRRVRYDNERKRLKKYSWVTRMSTEKGRTILMRQMLKCRKVLAH